MYLIIRSYKRQRIIEQVQEVEQVIAETVTPKKPTNKTTERIKEQEQVIANTIYPHQSLKTYLHQTFLNTFITPRATKAFADSIPLDTVLLSQLTYDAARYKVDCTKIRAFLQDFKNLKQLVYEHNANYRAKRLEDCAIFFDTVLKYPLDKQQRYSIVSEEENVLVVSSAGSGKTSSIIGKVRYLIDILHIDPKRILLISYTNKAALELTERLNTPGLRGYTFHKLAIDLIGELTQKKPSICENSDAIFVNIYKELIRDSHYKESVLEYFTEYEVDAKRQRQQELAEQKDNGIKTLFPDMDGNEIRVRSEQENQICYALTTLGVCFRYEESYEYEVNNELRSQYQPDFSIYYTTPQGEEKRIYLEHFAVDEHGVVPAWFAKEKGITWDEANKQYGDGITWKRELHAKKGTTLIETCSADFTHGNIKERLKSILSSAGVPYQEKTQEELYAMILPAGSMREKSFIRLIVTFATLLKTNCISLEQVYSTTLQKKDERNAFIIREIFTPAIKAYNQKLQELKQKDFTDLIIEATQLISAAPFSRYDYIIVDEFQDISIDRYRFLQALRTGNPPAHLYCVGDDWQSIYRFSGSDLSLFNRFEDFFGEAEIDRIETTYRFAQPLVQQSSEFVMKNPIQKKKLVQPFNLMQKTELVFFAYNRSDYAKTILGLIRNIPKEKKIYLLGRYSFDDYYLSYAFKGEKQGNQFFYYIDDRKIEFLTVHKSKGLEADVVILLQCNKDQFGFPSLVSDDPVLSYVLSEPEEYPHGEERRLFYVAITRAKEKTIVLFDRRFPSAFVQEMFYKKDPFEVKEKEEPRNANMRWGKRGDAYLRKLYLEEHKSIKQIASLMGRSQTSIVMRLQKLGIID